MPLFGPQSPVTSHRSKGPSTSICFVLWVAALTFLAELTLTQSLSHERSIDRPDRLPYTILKAEDARSDAIEPILEGLRGDLVTQRFSVRALGRLERPELVEHIRPFLSAREARVRAEAANALGQIAVAARRADLAAEPLRARVVSAGRPVETEPRVLAVVYETLGRLPYDVAHQVKQAERLLADLLNRPKRESEGVHDAGLIGAVKGLEALVRLHHEKIALDDATLTGLRACATGQSCRDGETRGRAVTTEERARLRRLALSALVTAGGSDEQTIRSALADADPQVRRLAVTAVTPEAFADARNLLSLAIQDRSYLVRYEALSRYARQFQSTECQPIREALRDRSLHIRLLAIDCLGGCAGSADTLEEFIRSLVVETGSGGWHAGAHAIVALARLSPDRAASWFPRLADHHTWQIRMYLARAAAVLKARPMLERLARDDHDNVANEAIERLGEVAGHDADSTSIEALKREDYQVVRTAARLLEGSPHLGSAAPALMAALARITTEERDTSRDTRLALLERLATSGTTDFTLRLQRYLSDFDPRVAEAAAATLTRLTGRRYLSATARMNVAPLPAANRLEQPRGAIARVMMVRGGVFSLRLYTDDAPATVGRFAALVERGYYNDLTFHRIVPNFVIQGGSPNANEYAGHARFMRDEVGQISHRRGTVGVSTRGRDTGDAQIFVNLVDNPRLDHHYTVFAEVVNGMDVVDGIVEGDIISRVEIMRGKN